MIKGIEYKNFNKNYHAGYHSPAWNSTNKISTPKPLQENREKRISFKGFNVNTAQNSLKSVIKAIPQDLNRKVFKSLKAISTKQYEEYRRIAADYVELVKTSPEFRKKYSIPDEIAEKISIDNLY